LEGVSSGEDGIERVTFAHGVVDHVVVDAQALRAVDSDGRGEAVVERTSLNVRVLNRNLSTQEKRRRFI